jgi:hypothetical protein
VISHVAFTSFLQDEDFYVTTPSRLGFRLMRNNKQKKKEYILSFLFVYFANNCEILPCTTFCMNRTIRTCFVLGSTAILRAENVVHGHKHKGFIVTVR